MSNIKSYERAIVIGGSIAGLSTAQVLSKYFKQVMVIERDRYPDTVDFRKGVPQMRQPHALLRRGLDGLEQLFPGFSAEFESKGAVKVDFGANVEWYAFGQWRPHYEAGFYSYGFSRPLLESTIRNRLLQNPAICFVEEAEVTDLLASPDRTRATGVKVRARHGMRVEDTYQADLIVDASGRESCTPDWLQSLGYERPKTTMINAFPGYASRIYERPEGIDFTVMYVQPTPPQVKRGGIILPLEGNRIHVSLIGMAKDYPPTDEQGFLDFAASLPDPRLYQVIKEANPVTPIVGYRRAENILHHYDQMPRWLDNFVVLGDAFYAFNPVYGQGMTVSIMCAQKLDECLQKQQKTSDDLAGLGMMAEKEFSKVIAFPWQLATGEDMRWLPITEGCPSTLDPITSFRLSFLKKVTVASTKSPKVAEVFYRVLNMTTSPAAFFRPDLMAAILSA